MKVKLVFHDWLNPLTGKSIYQTEEGIELSQGDLHSGTTFDAEVQFSPDDTVFIDEAKAIGAVPVFYVIKDEV